VNEHVRTAAMAEGRRADTARRRQRVLSALDEAAADGHELTVTGIAGRAGVDRTFLYPHLAGGGQALPPAPSGPALR